MTAKPLDVDRHRANEAVPLSVAGIFYKGEVDDNAE